MPTAQSFTGVILAGGASRRMGQDKANLTASNGQSMLTLMEHLLLEAGACNVVVLGRPGVSGGRADRRPYAGPVVAISDYLATQNIGSGHLIVPVDMPGLTCTLLRSLVQQDTWACYEGNNMPFFAVVDAVTPENSNRIGDLLHSRHAVYLPVPAGSDTAFANLNRPEEFARWELQHNQPVTIRMSAHA